MPVLTLIAGGWWDKSKALHLSAQQDLVDSAQGSYTPILPGDCIVSVNGMTAYSKLQKDGLTVSVIFLVASCVAGSVQMQQLLRGAHFDLFALVLAALGIGGIYAHGPFPRQVVGGSLCIGWLCCLAAACRPNQSYWGPTTQAVAWLPLHVVDNDALFCRLDARGQPAPCSHRLKRQLPLRSQDDLVFDNLSFGFCWAPWLHLVIKSS